MPGAAAEENMVGDYTFAELQGMSKADLDAAKARSFKRPDLQVTEFGLAVDVVSLANQAQEKLQQPQYKVPGSTPRPAARDDVWASANTRRDDFIAPSGQKCKLRPISPEALLEAGILDRVTRLEGLAATLAEQAEGAPPAKPKIPGREDFAALIETVNLLVPLAVAEPAVYPDVEKGEEPVEGRIYVSMISLDDRIGIMNEALKELKAMDSFRHA